MNPERFSRFELGGTYLRLELACFWSFKINPTALTYPPLSDA
jgi:hypothetical protein